MSTSYVDSQFEKLSVSEIYKLKITSDSGETHWLNISLSDVEAIRRLLNKGAPTIRGNPIRRIK